MPAVTRPGGVFAGTFRLFKTGLAWLLELNRPVPERTDEEIEAEVERNYSWNFAVNLLDGAFFSFGASFVSATTILPAFVSTLTTDPLPIGLVAVIAQGGWFLPQLFTANLVERLARKKPVVVNLGLFSERLPMVVMVLAAAVATRAPALALAVFLVGYAWHNFGAGVVATSWQDLIGSCFPVDRRGRFFGLTMFLGAGSGAVGAILSTWLLRTYPFPRNFVFTFTIAAVGIAISWVCIAFVREPVQPVRIPRQSSRQFLAALPDLLRRDHNFRRFLVVRCLWALGGMGTGFVTVAAVERWQMPISTAGVYTFALLLGQTIGTLSFGVLADRFGHKVCLELGILSAALGFVLAWQAPAPVWYYAVFLLLGIASGAVIVSGILVVMEFCEPSRRPTYIGMTNTGVGLVGSLAPLLGAALAFVGYGWLFAASAIVDLAAMGLMHWWVQEPRWATPQT
jgi:MFS family permease